MADQQTDQQQSRRLRNQQPPSQSNAAGNEPDTSAAEQGPGGVVSEQVTYTPGKEDPPSTTWGGHKFTANVPVTIKGHSGDPKKGECRPHERANFDLIEAAKKNKYFRVGEFDPQKDSVPLRETGKLPETPDQYRSHAIEWAKALAAEPHATVAQFNAKWEDEEGLRIKCGVGADDLDLINSVVGPLRSELVKRSSFPQ